MNRQSTLSLSRTPRLSIVVPFYRVESYIGACLQSIGRQSFGDFEVVLVDDGSTDDSAAIAREYADRDRRFRVVVQDNQGLGPARNTGVKHSAGEFITFVDSDDIVGQRAYELMIRALDQTGSSFAAGDVRRIDRTSVRESLVHRVPFARDRPATHVLEHPQLSHDRMVWNKVYRRSFWDEFGYEFPAMRYEDYPVALAAHLDAVTVDVLSAPVYYWRDRESGESISQRSYEYTNLVERVTSAEMVLDLVDERAPELRPYVHRHLAGIDLVTLLEAFRTVAPTEAESVVELGRRLIQRLDPTILDRRPSFDRLQYHALQRGDIEFLSQLAVFRHEGGVASGARARKRTLLPWQFEYEYPGRTDRRAPRSLYRLRDEELSLQTTVSDVRWRGSDLEIRGSAEILHLPTNEHSTLRITLAGPIPHDVTVSRFTRLDGHGDPGLVGFVARLGGTTLASRSASSRDVPLEVELVNGRVRRSGFLRGLRPGSPIFAEGRRMGGVWVQPGEGPGGRFMLTFLEHPPQVTSVVVGDGGFALTGTFPASASPDAHLVLTRASGGETVSARLEVGKIGGERSFRGVLPLAALVDDGEVDDLLTERTTWIIRLVTSDGAHGLVATGMDQSVSTIVGGRRVMLTRSPANFVIAHVSSAQFVADEIATTEDRHLAVAGPVWTVDGPRQFVWCRLLEDPDGRVDVPCRTAASVERWSAGVDLDELGAGARTGTWTLFVVGQDGAERAVRADEFLASRLPIEIRRGATTATVVPERGVVRLEVR